MVNSINDHEEYSQEKMNLKVMINYIRALSLVHLKLMV